MSDSSKRFWWKWMYIGTTRDISFPVVISLHQLSAIDLLIIAWSSMVILSRHLSWYFLTKQRIFFCKYNNNKFPELFPSNQQNCFVSRAVLQTKVLLIAQILLPAMVRLIRYFFFVIWRCHQKSFTCCSKFRTACPVQSFDLFRFFFLFALFLIF